MPYCPVCKTEYRDGFINCAECGTRLTDSAPAEPASNANPESELVLLTNIADGPVGETLLGKLRAYEIPYVEKYSDMGFISGIYTGRSLSGKDIYIPKEYLETARSLLFKHGVESWPEDEILEAEFIKMTERHIIAACEIYNSEIGEELTVDGVKAMFLAQTRDYPAFVVCAGEEIIGIAALRGGDEHQVGAACRILIMFKSPHGTERLIGLALSFLEDTAAKIGYDIVYALIPKTDNGLCRIYTDNGYFEREENEAFRLLKNIYNT